MTSMKQSFTVAVVYYSAYFLTFLKMAESAFPLHERVFNGDIKEVSKLLRSRDVAQKDSHGMWKHAFYLCASSVILNVHFASDEDLSTRPFRMLLSQ